MTVPLRWADTDAYGHIHHAVYLSLLEQARLEWLRVQLRVEEADWDHVLVRVEIDYLAELTLASGSVRCTFAVLHIGESSVRLHERVTTQEGGVVAEAATTIVAWDGDRRTTRRLSDRERALLA
jgi:acyl-CoA thioester hydrolase